MRKHAKRPSVVASGKATRGHGRRGSAVVPAVVSLTTLAGFAALAIDASMLYKTKTELQRTADAAALGAAGVLGDYSEGSPIEYAKQVAADIAAQNKVGNDPLLLDTDAGTEDILFGRATLDPITNRYVFEQTDGDFPNAVKVVARRGADSLNDPVPLWFANVFGKSTSDVSAEAIAVLVPRDIVLVADLSRSHNYDSQLAYYTKTNINNYEVWKALPETEPGFEGPVFGNMREWGTEYLDSSYSPSSDPGLVYLPYNQNWNNSEVRSYLEQVGYIDAEVDALMSATYDSHSSYPAWRSRVACALGLAVWRSGMPGGLWEQLGLSPGNGNTWCYTSELTYVVDYPYNSGSWNHYIGTKPGGIWNYQYGLKTWVDYLFEEKPSHYQTPELALTPHQPMQAVKDASYELLDIVDALDSKDYIGLVGYCQYGYGPDEKPDFLSYLTEDFDEVRVRLAQFQAGMWEVWTNISQGVDEGVDVLFASDHNARAHAHKVMILMTDGVANRTRDTAAYDRGQAREDTRQAARDARDRGVQIFTVSVGAGADKDLMQEIAGIGDGEWFHAEGEIEDYRAQLVEIFKGLGGKRPVMLVE